MAKQKRFDLCALCGQRQIITREHVPPKNLFLPPRPRNTITVPVCEPCNHGYHLDDEYFRVYVATGAKPGSRLGRLWKEKVVDSSFARSGGLQARLVGDQDKVIHHHLTVEPLKSIDGKVLDNALLPLILPFSASRITTVVEKIVRCLHFSLFGMPMSSHSTLQVDVVPLTDSEWQLLLTQRTGGVGDCNEFVFRRESTGDHSSCWLMAFYELHAFTVTVKNMSQRDSS